MPPLALSPPELAGRLALAVGLAVFLGLAFEETYKSKRRSIPGGIRSFPILAMAGAMLYLIEPRYALAFVLGLPMLAAWLYAFTRAVPVTAETASVMIPGSNLIAYAIGPVTLLQPPWVPVAVTVTAVLLLSARETLHRLIHLVPRDELLTAGEFLILVGIILPLVPDTAVTSLTPLTPYDVWLAVVAVCTLSYVSYLLQRYLPKRGMALLPAVLGGAYSSTATTVVLARRLRTGGTPRGDISAGIIAATAVMYVRLGIVIAIFNASIALRLAPALLGLCLIGAALVAFEWRRAKPRTEEGGLAVPPANPLQITTAAIFAGLLVAISIVTAWVRGAFGESGVVGLSALVGVTDIDPFVLNIAQGGVAGLSLQVLSAAVLIAAASNNVAKAAYAIGFGGATAGRRPALMLLLLAALGIGAAALYLAGA
jgi:uncharacterized membrane protein (DUF4010 family)